MMNTKEIAEKIVDEIITDPLDGEVWIKSVDLVDLARAYLELDQKHELVMETIYRLRAMEDSYDSEDDVLGDILLELNILCGT